MQHDLYLMQVIIAFKMRNKKRILTTQMSSTNQGTNIEGACINCQDPKIMIEVTINYDSLQTISRHPILYRLKIRKN